MGRLFIFGLTFFCCCFSPVFGADKIPTSVAINKPGSHSDLKDQQIYQVKFDCTPKTDLPSNWADFDKNMFGAVFHVGQSVNHQIMISNAQPAVDPSTQKLVLPSTSLSLFTLYSVAAQTGVVGDFRKLCTGAIYLEGGQTYNLIATISWSKQYSSGPVLTALYQFGNAISPLWSLFAPIPAAVSSKITNVQATQTPLSNILSDLNQDLTFGKAELLQTGEYDIVTPYSIVKITVSALPSLVRANSGTLLQAFRKQVDGATQKIDVANVASSCDLLASGLSELGFTQDEDVPYGLAYVASHSVATKSDMLNCLNKDYALAAAKLGPILWSYMPASKTINVQDALDAFPVVPNQELQPAYATIDANLSDFIVNLQRLGLGSPTISAQALPLLQKDMAPTALIVDQTSSFLFINDKTPLDAAGLGQALAGLNFHKYGCQSAMKPTYGDNPEGAPAIFLAFKAAANASTTTIDNVIAIRPLYKQGIISGLIVSDMQDPIKALLADHSNTCNGLSVSQAAPAAAGSAH
jgi:hypothetical protein